MKYMTESERYVLHVLISLGYEGICKDKHGRLNVYKHTPKGVYTQAFINGCDDLFKDVKSRTEIARLLDGEE